ncbi:MAG: shikimate kinase, partial [Parvibaculales bacterium]
MSKVKNRQAICSRPIVLIGMMGAGKSSLGLRLAEALKLPFLDADAEIEKAAAMSIAEIFDQHGETAFRDGERRVIKRLLAAEPLVLALGGGAFMNDETRALVQEKALAERQSTVEGLQQRSVRVERELKTLKSKIDSMA